jgi:DNA-binding transcriptional MerR regulator
MSEGLKVGELAERTGVSVRTLHYYEEVGLVAPRERTGAGHRLYGREEVLRLQQVRSLVQLGFSLDEVRDFLKRPEASPEHVLDLHIAKLDEALEQQRRLRQRLGSLARRLRAAEEVSVDDFLNAIEEMTMLEKHYTPEQLETLSSRAEALGPEGMEKAQAQWAELIAAAKAAMARGAEPTEESVQELARRWQGLVEQFTGGAPGIRRSLGNLYREDHAALQQQHGDGVPTPELMEFMGQAMQGLKRS